MAELIYQTKTEPYERLQALYQMAVELSALRSLESVLDTALKHCLDLTGSQFGFIGLNAPHGKALDVVAIHGFNPSAAFYEHNHLIPLRPNLFARAVLENRAVRTMDATTDPKRVGQPKGHPPVGTFMGVPLRIRNEPMGMIGVANRPDPYQDEHEQLLLTYAAQVAIVIRNAQLYEQLSATNEALEKKVSRRTKQLEKAKEALAVKADRLQELLNETFNVQEAERQRIAQDMHDGTNQLLIGAMLELKSAQKRISNDHLAQAEESLETVQNILHRVEAEIKLVIHDLRPPTLDALGLVPALRRYAERYESYTGIPCSVQLFGEQVRLPSRTEISVYRMAQEALQNVYSHARATQASIVITFSAEMVKLNVMDNGRGFDLQAVESNNAGHLGLLGMRERAESLGGRLKMRTSPGEGTTVELLLPVGTAVSDKFVP